MRVLTEADIKEVLRYEDLIPAMRTALRALSAGRVQQPVRQVLSIPEVEGWFAVMPAVYGEVMGSKMVTFYPRNAGCGKHTHMAVITLFRSNTGEPLATMDGRLITEMRTAAVSAVAADVLSGPKADVLAILGSGVQARSHLKALSMVRTFKEVRVWSRTPAQAEVFAAETGAIACSVEEAVADADIVLTATSSAEPVLSGRWLKRGAMVIAIGAVTPARRELHDDVMAGPVIVESREAASREAGDIVQTGAPIAAELGELLNGMAVPRSKYPAVFKSVGVAVEDIAAAALVYELTS